MASSHHQQSNSSCSSALTAASLSLMMEQERTTYACCNYLSSTSSSSSSSSGHHQSQSHHHDNDSSIMEYAPGSRGNPAIINNSSNDDDERQQQQRVTAVDRTKIVDWCYDIVDKCHFNRETVAVAMNIVDRFMSSASTDACDVDTDANANADDDDDDHDSQRDTTTILLQEVFYNPLKYQLVAMSALYISIKINEPSVLGSDAFSALSHGTYSHQDIERMERLILHRLSWRLCPPTSLTVAHQVLGLLLPTAQREMAKGGRIIECLREEVAFQIENSIRDNYFTATRPSTVALSAILNATEKQACSTGTTTDNDDNDDNDYSDDYSSEVYEHIIKGVVLLLKGFDFDSPLLLVAAKERLRCLTTE